MRLSSKNWQRLDTIPFSFGLALLLVFLFIFLIFTRNFYFQFNLYDIDTYGFLILCVGILSLSIIGFIGSLKFFQYQEFRLFHLASEYKQEKYMIKDFVKGFGIVKLGPKKEILDYNYEGRLKISDKIRGETIFLKYFHEHPEDKQHLIIHLGPINKKNIHLTNNLKKRITNWDLYTRLK